MMQPESGSPNKRAKTLTRDPDQYQPPPQSPPPSFLSKGKSKITASVSIKKEDELCCGICLSEGGRFIRGHVDSCSHYFCFVCIMEWAKVESKCPLCKRRFSTIRRPPKPPVFIADRLVLVPVCDQVYHYFGNATIGPPDPYSEVKCSVCNGKADESLLLLCDLCDSSAHTYCVGLCATVPEGDWFCHDCTLSRDEHLKTETNSDSCTDTIHNVSAANRHVSVTDIVREPYFRPPSSTDDETSVINDINQPSSTSQEAATQKLIKPNARTLSRCRDVHDRIRVLRENWNGFRSGTLHFSCSQESISCKRGRHSSVSCLNRQSKAQCSSSDVTTDIGTQDEIHKAWKMMFKAKSIKQDRERSSMASQASKCPIRKLNTIGKADFLSYRHVSPESQQNGSKNAGTMECRNNYKQPSSVSGKQISIRHMADDNVTDRYEGSIIGNSPQLQNLKSFDGVQSPSYMYNAEMKSEKLLAGKLFRRLACLSSSVASKPAHRNIDKFEGVKHSSSSLSNAKHPEEKIFVHSQQYDDAKSEIQSLVKLNLKLQTKEKKLEVEAFKKVARIATHSILAACGLEHPKPGYCPVPDSICSHSAEVRQIQKSSLMPNTCRECFYVFVKDMINTVLMQKKNRHK